MRTHDNFPSGVQLETNIVMTEH